jgi:hypothetical protein
LAVPRRVGRPAPVADAAARDAQAPGDLAVVEALGDELQGGGLDLGWMHSRKLREKL